MLKDVLCCTLMGRELHSFAVEGIKDFPKGSVLRVGTSLSNGLRMWMW